MPDRVTLRDGTEGWVWPLLPTDRAALVREFDALSPEARRRRFLQPVLHLSESMLTHLVDEVDGVDHVALVLMADVGDTLVPAGVARCVRYPHQSDAADVAVTVKEEWQGRGVATALLEVLMRRRPAGVTRILTSTTTDNPASLAMLRRLGPTHTSDGGPGILDVAVDLVPDGADGAEPVPLTPQTLEALHRPEQRRFRTRDLLCPWFRPGS